MGLSSYADKRDPEQTPEPDAEGGDPEASFFVIQEHDATSHHFDFRLALDGVLKSWAVPKGLSTDPSDNRLAIRTEDHPIEYADFEGVIPEDAYGGGPVLVWDRGPVRWKEDDVADRLAALEDGHLVVTLEGDKLSGGYALQRFDSDDDETWLIIKMDDDEADARRNPVSTEPESVASGRTIEEVAEEEEPHEAVVGQDADEEDAHG